MRAQRAGRRIGPFDRTYEGLKRLYSNLERPRTCTPFDRTYEGLKHEHSPGPPLGLRAFDRTYEGLKLHNVGRLLLAVPKLLTVPMRV